jgi:hypothetical protein
MPFHALPSRQGRQAEQADSMFQARRSLRRGVDGGSGDPPLRGVWQDTVAWHVVLSLVDVTNQM